MKYDGNVALDLEAPTEGFTQAECLQKALTFCNAANGPMTNDSDRKDFINLAIKWIGAAHDRA